ncbi:hypothetical protein Q4Q35_06295 [Flavivirga aquimarina]|uniref:Uncharacterized protein n=1 Tax=Flavivirga aquimarina TaxID=2027862 RepID=A0ABT8W8G7_9FLAO|nr:hypothetical protein [Flavivirga aquimarina]MDO5969411.1 hypothetical protein [Flavivirga aquimarina]
MTKRIKKLKRIVVDWLKDHSFWAWIIGGVISPAILVGLLYDGFCSFGQFFIDLINDLLPITVAVIVLVMIIFMVFLIIRLVKIKSIKKKQIQLRKKEDSIDNFEAISKFIIENHKNSYKQLGETLLNNYNDHITTLPIRYSYFKLVGDYPKIVFFSRTKINVKDDKGIASELLRISHIFPLDRDVDDFRHRFKFTKRTEIKSLIIDGKNETNSIKKRTKDDYFEVDFKLDKKFPRYELLKTTARLELDSCFISKKEVFEFGNSTTPVLYEKITLTLTKVPSKYACQKKMNGVWVSAGDDAILLDKSESGSGNKFSITYLINYQNISNMREYKKRFRIIWHR